MPARIAKSLVATALALPLLAGCGGGSTDAGPEASAAPATSAASSSAPAPSTSPTESSPSPSQTSDPAADKKDVAKASEKFVTTVLTIGYPDKSYTKDYLPRLKPLMTDAGYAAVRKSQPEKEGDKALKVLYPKRARSAPSIKGDVKVTALEGDSATAKVDYRTVVQQKLGSSWKTVKKLEDGSVTVTLVKDGGKWLVEDAD